MLLDGLNNRVQKKWCLSKHRTTIAGGNGSGLTNQLYNAESVFRQCGNIYITDGNNYRIQNGRQANYKQQWLEEMVRIQCQSTKFCNNLFIDVEGNIYC
jgi:hypothetical protein